MSVPTKLARGRGTTTSRAIIIKLPLPTEVIATRNPTTAPIAVIFSRSESSSADPPADGAVRRSLRLRRTGKNSDTPNRVSPSRIRKRWSTRSADMRASNTWRTRIPTSVPGRDPPRSHAASFQLTCPCLRCSQTPASFVIAPLSRSVPITVAAEKGVTRSSSGVKTAPAPVPVSPIKMPAKNAIATTNITPPGACPSPDGLECLLQNGRDFRPREFSRQLASLAKNAADLGAAQSDSGILAVSAGLGRGNAVAGAAIESVLEEQRRDAELAGVKFSEDFLRVVRAVIAAHPGVVAADNEMRATKVLSHQRVEDGLTRARVTHGSRIKRQHDAVARIVVLNQRFVAAQPNFQAHIVGFRLPGDRMKQQAVHD